MGSGQRLPSQPEHQTGLIAEKGGKSVADRDELVVVRSPLTRPRVLREGDPQVPERLVPTPHARAQGTEHVVDRPVVRPVLEPFGNDLVGPFEVTGAIGRQRGVPVLEWRWRQRRVRASADHDEGRSVEGRDGFSRYPRLDRDQCPRGGVNRLPGNGERGGSGSDQVQLLVTAGACAGLVMRLDDRLSRLGAVGVDGKSSDRERPANRAPDAVVERDPLELAQMRAPVTGQGWRIADLYAGTVTDAILARPPCSLRRVHGIAEMRDTHTGDDCRIPEDGRCVREVVEQPHSCA